MPLALLAGIGAHLIGFLPSTRVGVKCEYEVPEEVFMGFELLPGYLRGASGTIKYHAAFSNL